MSRSGLLPKFRLSGLDEPLFQNGQIVWIHILEAYAHALVGLGIGNDALGLEISPLRVDLEQRLRSLCEWIGHLHVASVQTQLRHAGGNTSLCHLFNDLSGRNEWQSRSSPSLVFHGFTPGNGRGILPLVEQVRGQNTQLLAKVREKRLGRNSR